MVWPMPTTIKGLDDLRAKAGEHLGYSDWQELTQDQVNLFADATGDHQWIHVDVERAKQGPFGGPIAHGYLTLSLVPALMGQIVTIEGMSMGLNYGCNKVRFPSPLPVGAKLRLGASLQSVEEVAGGVQAIIGVTIEVQSQEKPACVADVVYRYYD
jgi:acyl dehydratase